MFLSEWRKFSSAPCLEGGKKTLMTARVSMLLKSRASLTCFRACFLPDRAKDLSAPRNFLYRGSYTGVQLSGRETDHSQAPSAEVKWSYTSTLPYLPSWRCEGHPDNSTIYLPPLCAVHLEEYTSHISASIHQPGV